MGLGMCGLMCAGWMEGLKSLTVELDAALLSRLVSSYTQLKLSCPDVGRAMFQ